MDDSKDRGRESGRDRDRSRRGDRPSRFSENSVRDRSVDRGGGGGRKSSNCRVYVSNISYEYRWQDLKDLFRENVGDVSFVELFVDENDKPKGCGIVEFSDPSLVKKCMEVMHRFDLKGRKLVIKEDFGNERDKYGNIINGRKNNRDRDRHMDKGDWDDRDSRRGGNWDTPPSLLNNIIARNAGPAEPEFKWGNTYGLSPQFLESLNIHRPLVNRVFVANLDYKVDEKKLREVFKLCGKVLDVELYHDKEGNSRGFAVVEFDHPVESVQAISMLHNQLLYDRPMTVRMDRIDHDSPLKLPEGLKGVGMGLGLNGEALRDVSRNLPSNVAGTPVQPNMGPGILGAVPNQSLQQALTTVVGNSTLAHLTQNPFLTNNLANTLTSTLNNSLGDTINLTGLTSSLNNLNPSLTQNNAALMALSSGSNSHSRDFRSNDTPSNAFMLANNVNTASNVNTSVGSNITHTQDQMRTAQITNTNREYTSSSRDYESSNPNVIKYEVKPEPENYRHMSQTSVYSTVNNGSQNRSSTNNVNNSRGNGFSDTIIISNLPITATWKMLKEKFSSIGEVQYVEMKTKDTAIIRYSTEWYAERAIKLMDRSRIDGRTIDVRFFY